MNLYFLKVMTSYIYRVHHKTVVTMYKATNYNLVFIETMHSPFVNPIRTRTGGHFSRRP